MATGSGDERRPLLARATAARRAREGIDVREDGVHRLSDTAVRLRDALKLQSELASALKKKNKKKARSSRLNLFRKKKKKKKNKTGESDTESQLDPRGLEPKGEGGGAPITESVNTVSADVSGDDGNSSSDTSDDETNEQTESEREAVHQDVIRLVYEGAIVTDDALIHEAVARGADIEALVQSMLRRSDELNIAADVFAKNPPVAVLEARKRRRILAGSLTVGGILLLVILIIVLATLHPWKE